MRIGFAFNLKPALAGMSPSGSPLSSSNDAGRSPPGEASSSCVSQHEAGFAEWDTEDTIEAVAAALSQVGDVVLLEANGSFPNRLRRARPDLVFNMAESRGGRAREAHVPAILEYFGFRYTGSDPLTLAITLDKVMTKTVLAASGIRTPAFRVCEPGVRPKKRDVDPPVIVKPLHEGSSIGVRNGSLCHSYGEAVKRVREIHASWAQPALIETFLPGREFTCALVGNGSALRAYPLVEMDFAAFPEDANPIYSYEAKWVWDRPSDPLPAFRCPARVDERLEREITQTAMVAYRALGCRDWARIDLRLDERERVHVLEVNALPGVLPDPNQNSSYPKAARAAGLDFDGTILAVVEAARVRYRI
ncbi:MAG: D-alanine--D-alanine ligase [Gemmatimonadota bacterium]